MHTVIYRTTPRGVFNQLIILAVNRGDPLLQVLNTKFHIQVLISVIFTVSGCSMGDHSFH